MEEKTGKIESAQLARTAIIELMLTGSFVQEQLTEALKPYNLSIAQFNVLRILRGQKGKPASLSCVHDKMIHKMSNTTRLVDKLLEKQLVERITCPENRRKVEITITSKGLDLLRELDEVVETSENGLVSNLNDAEVRQLIDMMRKLKE